MISCYKIARGFAIIATIICIATYIAAGMSPLIYLAFIEITEPTINLCLVSIGSILLGLTGCLVLFGTYCEKEILKQDLLPVYWLLYSLLNAFAFFLTLAELGYITNEFPNGQTSFILFPIAIILTFLTVLVSVLSCVLQFLYRFSDDPKVEKAPEYDETEFIPPPKYEEVFTPNK